MRIRTLPVYSKLADVADVPPEVAARLPKEWQLSQHQVETYLALTTGDAEVIFNTAMTGDGKSLAAYLPTLVNGGHAFGMYPTIELSRDQSHQYRNYCCDFGVQIPHKPLWGAEITRLARDHGYAQRGEWLVNQFKNNGVILTNPDIFNLVMNYRYRTFVYSRAELPYSLQVNFDYFVLDEFHIFSIPQIVSALTAMLWFIEANPSQSPKFVFSSATPDPLLIEMVERTGLKHKIISGTYTTEPSDAVRPVLHETTLHLHKLNERQNAEDWLVNNLSLITDLWQNTTGRRPKGAIIVNSVAAARRITRMLGEHLSPYDISVGENTGLTDMARRALAREKDIVVGTSTIDVGVDFDINFLVFEATDAGNFLQRFGRLGRVRHTGEMFESYQAHTLISGRTPWIYENLVNGLETRKIREGDAVDRHETLATVIRGAFPPTNDFVPYARRWGSLQAAHVLAVLLDKKLDGAYDSLADVLRDRYARFFRLPGLKGANGRYWSLRNNKMDGGEQVLDEILSFRGTSPFQVGLWDATVEPPAFRPYNVFFAVQATAFEPVGSDEFEAALKRWEGDDWELTLDAFKYGMKDKSDKPFYLKVTEIFAERESLVLKLNENLSEYPELLETICVLNGFRVDEPRTSYTLPVVNKVLKRQSVVCCISKRDRRELYRRLQLPPFFSLYRLRDQRGAREYTVAFGKAALMLEPLLWRLRDKDEDNAPIIC